MVDDLSKQLEFLKTVFQAATKEEISNEEGITFHDEVAIGEVVIMLDLARPEWPARKNMNYVFVEKADETYHRAIQKGCSNLMEPADRDYGMSEGGFSDPHGIQWWVASTLNY